MFKYERGILWLGAHLLYSFDCQFCSATHPTHGVNPCLHYENDIKLSLHYSRILLHFKVQDNYYVTPSTAWSVNKGNAYRAKCQH